MCKILVNMIKQSMKTEQFNSIERMLKVKVKKRKKTLPLKLREVFFYVLNLFRFERKQRCHSRTLDCGRQLALVLRAGTAHSAGKNFSAFRHELL